MPFVKPQHSRGAVDKAGQYIARLADEPTIDFDIAEWQTAWGIFTNWRESHLHPLNTFQATLRKRLQPYGKLAQAAQRVKRTPSIVQKLRREPKMALSRMHDIVGLRAILPNMTALDVVHHEYLASRSRHVLAKTYDYIADPKEDGYRSTHLVFKYNNKGAPAYNGLRLEVQLRTSLQHSWATAIETVDAFEDLNMKGGKNSEQWSEFFRTTSALFSYIEQRPVLEALRERTALELAEMLMGSQQGMRDSLNLLRGYRVAADHIQRVGIVQNDYYLVVLDLNTRRLQVNGYDSSNEASDAYAKAELEAKEQRQVNPVLIQGVAFKNLHAAYPNYFLDVSSFIMAVDAAVGRYIMGAPAVKLRFDGKGRISR